MKSVNPDSMLTTYDMIRDAKRQVATDYHRIWSAFARTEPELADFVEGQALETCGKMGLCGCRLAAVQGVRQDMCQLALTVFLACRRGEYELWKDTVQGTRLADLWQSLDAKAMEFGEQRKRGWPKRR